MKILLTVDGSRHTRRTARFLAEHIADFAKPPTVQVLYVHAPIPYAGAATRLGRKAVEDYQREDCEAALAVARKELTEKGVAFEAAWRVGDTAREIAAYVKENRIDLVFMGSHGHGAFGNLVLGSVATKVIATTKVPVLIVR